MKHEKHSHQSNPKPAAGPSALAEARYSPSPDEVARRAYFCYENEGSLPGHEVQHWLKAEADLIAERNLTRVHAFRHEA